MVARQYVSEIESNEQQTKLKPRSKICLLNNRVIAVTAVSEDKSQVNKYNHERGENVHATAHVQYSTTGTSNERIRLQKQPPK